MLLPHRTFATVAKLKLGWRVTLSATALDALDAKVRRKTEATKQNRFVLNESDMVYSHLMRGCASILISMQRYEWLAYVQGQAYGSSRKSPHLRVVFLVETLH